MWAVFSREIRAVELFIKNKCDLTHRSLNGTSAVDYAILGGNYLMAYYLTLQGVEVQNAEFYYAAAKKRN